jgi:hypothetical protein
MADSVLINGSYDPAFNAVREALAQNLAEGDELGEVVSVVINGKTVVDLWGGYKDRARTQPWERDTLVCMFSEGWAPNHAGHRIAAQWRFRMNLKSLVWVAHGARQS